MVFWGVLAILAAPVFESGDVPPGSDVVLRVEVGRLGAELGAAVEALAPLGDAWAPWGALQQRLDELWQGPLTRIATQTQADWRRPGVVAVVALDLDAPGELLWSAVVRGARDKKTAVAAPSTPVESFLVDEQPAYRLPVPAVAWSVVQGDRIVLGDERGLQRHLRHLRAPPPQPDALLQECLRVRTRAPIAVAFVLPEVVRERAKEELPIVGAFIREILAGHLLADAKEVGLTLQAPSDDSRDALVHAARSLAAALRARSAHLETGAEALLGLDRLGAGGEAKLPGVGADTLTELTRDWLSGFSLSATVRPRAGHRVEVELAPSGMRGLVAAAGHLLLEWLAAALPESAAAGTEDTGAADEEDGPRARESSPGKRERRPGPGLAAPGEAKEERPAAAGEKTAPEKRAAPAGGKSDKAPGAELHQL
jgi:hypothetical protein